MVFSNANGAYDIYVQPKKGESEVAVLWAVAHASFELALIRPGIEEIPLEQARELVNACVTISDHPGTVVVNMIQIGNRWCATVIERVEPNHFSLNNIYQQYRGVPDPMLKRAQAILQTAMDM